METTTASPNRTLESSGPCTLTHGECIPVCVCVCVCACVRVCAYVCVWRAGMCVGGGAKLITVTVVCAYY